MTQMEHVYVSWGLGGGDQALRYGDDDYAGGSVETIEDDIRWYFEEVALSDAAIASMVSLDAAGAGHGRTLRAVLVKMSMSTPSTQAKRTCSGSQRLAR